MLGPVVSVLGGTIVADGIIFWLEAKQASQRSYPWSIAEHGLLSFLALSKRLINQGLLFSLAGHHPW